MKVLITGACGYLARSLIKELEGNHELRLLDRSLPQDATQFNAGGGERIAAPFSTRWPFVQAEITDADAMREAARGMDAVIHLAAAVTGLPEFGVETFRDNALGTYVILDAARLGGVQRFLCASSVNAYGTIYWRISDRPIEYSSMPLTEAFDPVPEDAYSLGKLVGEETCAAFHRAFGITTAAFRFAGVWHDKMYREKLEAGLPPTTQWSDDLYQWVHVEDLVRGLKQALEAPDLPECGVYNLGAADTLCPEPTMEILQRLRPDLAIETPLEGRAPLLSIDRARQAFGYAPRHRMGA